MIRIIRLGILIVTISLFGASSACASLGVGLLEDAVLAPYRYSFVGTMLNVTWSDGQPVSRVIKTFHANPDRNRWEYLDADGKPFFIIINDSGKQWEISTVDQTVYLSIDEGCCLLEEAPAELTRLSRNYQVLSTGSAAIAGRQAAVYTLHPLYPANPIAVLWIDVETGVVLRYERYSPAGDLLELRAYTSFEPVRELDPDLFTYTPSLHDKIIIIEHPALPEQVITLQKQIGETIRYPTGLPPGYRFSKARVLSRFRPADTVQLQFADGLNSISVFQTFYPDSDLFGQGAPSSGVTKLLMADTEAFLVKAAEGYVLTWRKGNVTYSIVGNLPVEELKKLAHSFRD